ncbi:protein MICRORCHIDIA 7-like isoform X3 [Oryza glaberrima]|uniref:protein MICRORCHIDIA 7-like isoform X3 n=1 Tax=Oryza glaberrima TaxID=4538 RepID=UPI00224BFB6E|nr:protein MICRORCHIDIA 7-like isoform X3 [Oryza glaberrima]
MAPAAGEPSAAAGGGEGDTEAHAVIDVSSSETDSDPDPGFGGAGKRPRRVVAMAGSGREAEKRARILAAAVPPGFLDPLPRPSAPPPPPPPPRGRRRVTRQFWNAGDYDGKPDLLGGDPTLRSDSGMDHIRVHPRFLHSNATSHKWALGAFAELLDNSLDEVANGATYVNIDMLENKKDGTRMVSVEDDGGGMDPDKMWHCMSLGYSAKSKVKDTIGQYGNGFKTSTMRLGADVLVLSRSCGNGGRRRTQSIGMLSYTFLRETRKDDIIVPMIDYEKGQQYWKRMMRTTSIDWQTSLATIIEWSPYSSEAELLQEFSSIKEQGTRIIIYNLWENEQGELELDFDTDVNDIQIRGGNRDQKNIQLAKQFPNSRHFFTYRHSLQSYASILYLRVPSVFQMILRGKEIEHHNIIGDMMMKNHVIYKPVMTDGFPRDIDMMTDVTIGFVKDAKHHIPIQGFNVYHKNRLIKPFWRVWALPGIQGRGVIGVLEVNFVEPAHDKQDFERTNSLARLEARLNLMQKKYWSDNCHRIGYGGNSANRKSGREYKETSPENTPHTGPTSDQSPEGCRSSNYLQRKRSFGSPYSGSSNNNSKTGITSLNTSKISLPESRFSLRTTAQQTVEKTKRTLRYTRPLLHGLSHTSNDSDAQTSGTPSRSTSHILKTPEKSCHNENTLPLIPSSEAIRSEGTTRYQSEERNVTNNGDGQTVDNPETVIKLLTDENSSLKESIMKMEESLSRELHIERDKNKSLIERLENVQKQLETANKEQEALVDIFTEERARRDQEVENQRTKLKEASSTIQNLLDQLNAARSCRKN